MNRPYGFKSELKICLVAPTATNQFVGGSDSVGGAELQVFLFATGLAKQGHNVIVIVNGVFENTVIENVKVIGFNFRCFSKNKIYYLLDYIKLSKTIFNLHVDFCITRSPPILLVLLSFIKKLKNFKLVKMIASDFEVGPNSIIIGKLYRKALRKSNIVLFQYTTQREKYYKFVDHHSVIPNIAPEKYITANKAKSSNFALWVGAFDENKHIDKLIELAKNLPKQKFVVVAKNSEGIFRNLEVELKNLQNVEYLGFVPFEMMDSIFQEASIYLNTSDYEGFPNTFLQAWSNRTIIISLYADPDGVLSKKNLGLLCHGSMKKMEDLIMFDNDTFDRIVSRGFRYVSENHSEEIVLSKLIDLLYIEQKSPTYD
jgi:glycosyltransferase involved in cell wall biosynthesis